MNRRTLSVPLKGFGSSTTIAHVEVESLTLQQRMIRSLVIIALGTALALVALPIPQDPVPSAEPSSGWAWPAEPFGCLGRCTVRIADGLWTSEQSRARP